MRHLLRLQRTACLVFPALLACSVPKEAGFPEVAQSVAARGGERVRWLRGETTDEAIAAEIAHLLANPLTAARAVQIALFNNRALQATFEQLGVAQAELIQAGMLENPSIGVDAGLAVLGGAAVKISGDLGFDFVSLFSMAARVRIAEADFDATKLRVAADAVEFIGEVKKAFYRFQAAQQRAVVDAAISEAAQGSYETALALHEAGNVSDLQLAHEQDLYERVRVEVMESQGAVVATREAINRLLGLWGPSAGRWRVEESLPAVPAEEVSLEKLESLAIAQRLDLAAAQQRTLALAHSFGMARDWGWLAGGEAGASVEREIDGELLVGPRLELQLPLFDQGQAKSAKALAELRQSQNLVSALAVGIRSEVRERRAELLAYRHKAEHYRTVVIPLRERIVKLTQEEYNFMLIGVFELLQKKQEEQAAYHEYLDLVRDYWLTRVGLETTVGGRLTAAPANPANPSPASPSPSETPRAPQ
ncbi:MAG: TolC family protein [Myxococcales bacterium]|nr:TolC family protein [Myxococcales bacterium]